MRLEDVIKALDPEVVLTMWWKRKSPEPTLRQQPKLDVNLEWPDGKGFTECSADFHRNSMDLERSHPTASAIPERYERYAHLLRERDRLIKEGHTGRAFRCEKTDPPEAKIRVARGFFAVERQADAVECLNQASRAECGTGSAPPADPEGSSAGTE